VLSCCLSASCILVNKPTATTNINQTGKSTRKSEKKKKTNTKRRLPVLCAKLATVLWMFCLNLFFIVGYPCCLLLMLLVLLVLLVLLLSVVSVINISIAVLYCLCLGVCLPLIRTIETMNLTMLH